MEFQLTFGLAELGRPRGADQNAERLIEAFESEYPQAEPVVDADLRSGVLSVSFSVEAEGADSAIESGRPIFAAAAAASGLASLELVRIEVAPTEAPKPAPA